jgi:hypothetical protein
MQDRSPPARRNHLQRAQEPSLDRPRDGLFFFVLLIGGEESCDWTDQ